jgi:predicted ribosome quality control (RQC) complex YloA/Tae2 family protein
MAASPAGQEFWEMAFDSAVMTAVVRELHTKLAGGRVSKIYQPGPDELILMIYAGGANWRLLLSAHPRWARLHLTAAEKRNPPVPPTFCMLLRKHLEGGRLLAVTQPGRERLARLTVGSTDELGNPVEYVLVAEVMGKHSNLVLVGPGGRIIDSARRVTEAVNRYREILPGLPYVPPPPTGKADPDAAAPEQFAGLAAALPAWQAVLERFDGLGPLLAREAVVRAGGAPDAALASIDAGRLAAAVRELGSPTAYQPSLLYTPEGRLKEFHVLPLRSWVGPAEPFTSPGECLDAYYIRREEEERFAALHGSLARTVRDALARVRRKIGLQEESLSGAEEADRYRLLGELLTANIWRVAKGQELLTAENYHDGRPVAIPLDPRLSPAENAQAYYRRYQKARSGLAAIREQLARSAEELRYLEQVEAALASASSLPDLEEIRRELHEEGYLGGEPRGAERGGEKRREAGRGRAERPAPPVSIRSSDGLEIWVGRNNRQNDYLTLRLAAPTDYWLHTKEIAGSHVILRVPPGSQVPEQSLHEAAALAAWYSKARLSAAVPVDYTLRKHVRKPAGARPGMVIYDNQRTLYVTPDPALNPILRLLADAGRA